MMHDSAMAKADPRLDQSAPLDAALTDLSKTVSGLEDQIELLDVRLRPVSAEEVRGESPPILAATRGSSPAVKRVDEEAQRVARLADRVSRLCGGLEV